MSTGKLVVGITGASGAIYAQRFLLAAVRFYSEIYLTISEQAIQVANTELNVSIKTEEWSTMDWLGMEYPQIRLLEPRNFYTPPASGSFRHDGMVIVPCSMGSIGRIANGISDDLLTRAADVCLKERRKLIVVPREMPYSLVMLRNMAQLVEAGGIVLPASPAWYHRPTSVEQLADTVVARILQQLGIEQDLTPQWQTEKDR